MKKIVFLSTLVLTFLMLLFSCGKDENPTEPGVGGPNISSFSPTSGPVGTSIFITGQNFSTTASANTVKIGNTTAPVTSASATEIFITVPEGATTGALSITVDEQTDTAETFTVTEESGIAGITLNKSTLNLFTLDTETLKATVEGGGSIEDIVWSSENEEIATVNDNGMVTALKSGNTNIIATIQNISQSCSISIEPNIYVLGSQSDNNLGTFDVTLWINNKPSVIEDAFQVGKVFVYNSDIYTTGESINDNGPDFASVWKNGVPTNLTSGLSPAEALSVFVEDGNVYVAGRELEDVYVSKVWKNGELLYNLTDGTYSSRVHSIFVKNGEVYVAGTEYVENKNVAKVWKNGVSIQLSENANAYSVLVHEDIIYAVGSKNNIATIWVDGLSTSLINGSNWSLASSIFIQGRDIYACGFERIGDVEVAIQWKNGIRTDLTDGKSHADANAIFVNDSDVYVAGWEQIEDKDVAKVWKNGELYFTLDTNTHSSRAQSIFVR
ncbi:MAG: IPT/TIG domain-containing protein [Bacteroidota bacterium]